MSTANHTIRKFNRFELKYLLTLRQAEQFKSALRTYMTPDQHGHNDGRYALTSLYFDSPDLRCYWEKEYGLRFRRKLRIRRYETGEPLTEATPVFVEIKQRVDRVTQKRRAVLPYGDALRLCLDRHLPDCAPEERPVVEEIYAFLWQYNLRPMSIVRYDRQAFTGSDYDIGLRVTFDSALSFQMQRLSLHEEPSALPMLPAHQVVMEIKINEHMPLWLTELIADQNLKMVRVSKYCRSIEAAQNMPALRWNSLPAESSEEMLASSLSVFNRLEQKLGIGR
ncbi:MAG: polyphosphate polymerase domain-containing protein [Chloroflexi bacterium]|nr:polyphosphate polymerase domain-containing protein [Chloroflexota bacterium]